MPNVNINRRVVLSGGLNAATSAWITRVIAEGGSVTPAEIQAINAFIGSIPISEFDRLWVHGLQNQIAARTSIANAATADLITNVNSTTFTAGEGFTGNGTTMYLETGFVPSMNGVKFELNNCSFGAYVRNNVTGYVMGGGAGVNYVGLAPRTAGNLVSAEITSLNSAQAANADSSGLWVAGRTGAINPFIYGSGSEITITTNPDLASTGLTASEITLLAYGGAGQTTHQISMTFFGSGSINQPSFYTSAQALATILGFEV